jgi:antidote-toxin recognition MazE-like antitoxin
MNSSRGQVRSKRKRFRHQGLRRIEIWVPDVNSPAFTKETHRQSRADARSAQEKDDQDFIDAISAS